MLKRTLSVLGIVGCLSAIAPAEEILFNYNIPGDTDPAAAVIEVNEADLPLTTTLTVALGDNQGGVNSGGIGFNFDLAGTPEIGLANWAWDSFFDDPNNWFPDNTLPAPVVVSFSPPIPLPASPDAFIVATADITITGAGVLSTGAFSVDNNGAEQVLDPSASALTVNVIPEPATLALMAIGGLSMLRRRRA